MAALAFLGKLLLGLLLLLFALLLVALFVPVAVWVSYRNGALSVRVGALCFGVTVYPPKPKKQARKKSKPKEPAPKQKEEQPKPAGRKKAALTFDLILETVKAAGKLLRAILGSIKITHIVIRTNVEGEDAAETALQYGKRSGALYAVLGLLSGVFWMEFDELYMQPAFLPEQRCEERYACKLSARLYAFLVAGVAFLVTLWRKKVLRALL